MVTQDTDEGEIILGVCIDKLPHTCGSRRGLQVYLQDDNSVSGYCWKCKEYVANPYGEDKPNDYRPAAAQPKGQEEIQQELDEILEYGVQTLHDRKLNQATLEHFGIKIGVSEADGNTPVSHHYPYKEGVTLRAFKNRIIDTKQMWFTGDAKGVDLFGWEQAIATGAIRLYVTEGELDAAALWQMIMRSQKGTQYADRIPAVVSLTRGASSASKDLASNAEKIRKTFKEVVLVFDQDDAGSVAVQDALNAYPEALTVSLPSKDANECLIEGKSKAAVAACLWNASAAKNTHLVWGSDLIEEGRKETEWGFSWPWDGLTQLTRGIFLGNTYYLGAGVKMGKSEVVDALTDWFIRTHGWKVFTAKPEQSNVITLRKVVGKAAGRIFHDPKIPFDYEAYDKWAPQVAGNLCMVNLFQHLGWESLRSDIRMAAAAGCQAIIIDPITNLTVGLSPSEANTKLQEIAVELSSMSMDLDIAIFIFCHLKAPEGTPHEMGGAVYSNQFAGSRAMMRSCDFMIGLEGHKDPDLPAGEKNLRDLVVLEAREGETGRVNLAWSPLTGEFSEI
jgi:twinkle protein